MTTCKLVSAVALLSLAGCSGASADESGTPDKHDVTIAQSNVARVAASEVSASDLNAAVAANNAFGLALYAEVLKTEQSKNLLTSPISATLALTMTYAGAQGATKAEMAAALHLAPQGGDAIFAGQNALSQALNGRAAAALSRRTQQTTLTGQAAPQADDYQLQVVNSVWGEQSYTWETPFLDTLAAHYGTGVYKQDFQHAYEPARATINGWVSEHTNDKINDLLPKKSVDSSTRMVLVNAIHLKLPWETSFAPSATSAANFVRGDASTVSTAFMHRTAALAYVDDGHARVVSLPLSNRELELVIALPHADVTLADYEASLAADSSALTAAKSDAQVVLSLPKATFTSPSVSLTAALKALGMIQAFDGQTANFDGLCAHPPDGNHLYVSDVLQKSMIAMQETGVEAAAATAVLVAGTSLAPPEPPVTVEMNVNRPYLIAIVDRPTGALLMLGHIQDPSDAGNP
jgi:serine protease inhibitor